MGRRTTSLDPRRNQVWVTIDGSRSLEVRSASTGRLQYRPNLGGAPHDVGFAAGYRTVWFSNWNSGTLTVVDAVSRRVRARFQVGREPHHFAAARGVLWVTDHGSGSLLRVDLRSGRVVRRTPVGEEPHHVAVAGPDVLVAVHSAGDAVLVSAEGRSRRRIAVGAGPHGIAALRLPQP